MLTWDMSSVTCLLILLGVTACSSAPARKEERLLPGLIPTTLRIRDKDCESISTLYKGLPLVRIRECLVAQSGGSATYRLVRSDPPYWELEKEGTVTECIRIRLTRIPVSREIVYQSKVDGKIECFKSRVDLENERMLGVKVSFASTQQMTIKFPLLELIQAQGQAENAAAMRIATAAFPTSVEDTAALFEKSQEREVNDVNAALLKLLAAWSLTPLFDEGGRLLRAFSISDSACLQCLSDRIMIMSEAASQQYSHWPKAPD